MVDAFRAVTGYDTLPYTIGLSADGTGLRLTFKEPGDQAGRGLAKWGDHGRALTTVENGGPTYDLIDEPRWGQGQGQGFVEFFDPNSGRFVYNTGGDFLSLLEGETRTVSFSYTVTDSDGAISEPATVTILIEGQNDGPFIGGPGFKDWDVLSEAANEQSTPTVTTGQITAVDYDTDGVLTWSVQRAPQSAYGNFSVNATTGEWRYELDDSLPQTQALSQGQQVVDQYIVRVTDNHGAYSDVEVVLFIRGADDAPVVVSQVNPPRLTQGSAMALTPDMIYSDVDSTASEVTVSVVDATGGRLWVNGQQASQFTGAQLAAGQVVFQQDGSDTPTSFTFSVVDGRWPGSSPRPLPGAWPV